MLKFAADFRFKFRTDNSLITNIEIASGVHC